MDSETRLLVVLETAAGFREKIERRAVRKGTSKPERRPSLTRFTGEDKRKGRANPSCARMRARRANSIRPHVSSTQSRVRRRYAIRLLPVYVNRSCPRLAARARFDFE